ncbi:MAG: Shedu anti-phage system protein SduA domain-containing protein [Bacteroidia bacterium]
MLKKELGELRNLIESSEKLDEQKVIQPFFRKRKQLSAFIGSFVSGIDVNRLSFELDLFGDFSPDLVLGDYSRSKYCFVEFESGLPHAIFKKSTGRKAPKWSGKFEEGYSQIVDWFWKVEEQSGTASFRKFFEADSIACSGLLIIGRDKELDSFGRNRMNWRSEKVVVNSSLIQCMTYDSLLADLERRIMIYNY